MTGREEIDLKNEQWITNKLQELPEILTDYMYSIKSKTSWSRRNYLGYLIQFFGYLESNGYDINNIDIFKEIRPLTINKYLDYISFRVVNGVQKENKAGIKAAKLFAVSDFFEFLFDNDFVVSNPCKRVNVPKDNEIKEVVAMTSEEIKTIENNIMARGRYRGKKYNLRDLCIVMLGVSTGLRVSAIIEINVQDINFESNYISVIEKGNKARRVFIGEKTKDILEKWIVERKQLLGDKECDALFISKNKVRMSTESVRQMLKKETVNIDKHITPHKMRSTCATNLYNATGDIYLVQEQLAHANIANTRRYAKVSKDRMVEASNILNDII